jgi:phage gpG-like protein
MSDDVVVRVKVHSRDVKKMLNKMEKNARSFKPVFVEAEKTLQKAYTANFSSQGGAVGGWAPLDADYAAWKVKHYGLAPKLVQSGELFRSISNLNVRDIGDKKAIFGTDLPIAKFHQYGTWSMPERRLIFEPPMFAKNLAQDAADHVLKGA